MNVLPDILATDSNLDSDYEESQEEIGKTVFCSLCLHVYIIICVSCNCIQKAASIILCKKARSKVSILVLRVEFDCKILVI